MTMSLEKAIIGIFLEKKVPICSRLPNNWSLIFKMISRGGTMKTVTLDVRTPADSMADFTKAWKKGKSEKSARISFATPELLWQILTAKRWELLKVLCGAGPVSIREAARRVGRDVKAVHGDVTALLNAGILVRTDKGRIVFPFDTVKVEFLLHAA
jgi:predicted transcriptional regulator